MTRLKTVRAWVSAQPDRPFVILFGHAVVVLLYSTHHAVSKVPFRGTATRTIVSSPLIPALHGLAVLLLVYGIYRKGKGFAAVGAAGVSVTTWTFTTVALFFASTQRNPPLALWSCGLSLVITIAAFLMLVRWGADGDDSEDR